MWSTVSENEPPKITPSHISFKFNEQETTCALVLLVEIAQESNTWTLLTFSTKKKLKIQFSASGGTMYKYIKLP